MASFTASDGIRLAYYVDDFTDPWKQAPSLAAVARGDGEFAALLRLGPGAGAALPAGADGSARPWRLRGAAARSAADPGAAGSRVIELMDHLGLAGAHIVGNSAGGYLGQQLAMNHRERVRSLMLFGSTPGLKNSQAAGWIPRIAAKGLRGFLAETIAERLPLAEIDPGLVEWFLDEAAKNDPAYIGRFVLLMASYDWSGELGRIGCPTLVVVPGAEPIGSTANYEPFRRLVPDVEMRVYDGAPHNICDAYPDRCAADVLDFLGRRFGLGR